MAWRKLEQIKYSFSLSISVWSELTYKQRWQTSDINASFLKLTFTWRIDVFYVWRMQKHTKRQVKVNFKKDAFISDVCHRCLCVISDQTEMAKGEEYLCVRYSSNGISMFVKYYLISRKPPLRLRLLHFLKKKKPKWKTQYSGFSLRKVPMLVFFVFVESIFTRPRILLP